MYFDVQTCTKSKPFYSCLCLWSGSFTRILYFEVQTGTKTNLSLVFHVYGVVLLLASCTLVYKRAPEQAFFSCLSLWDGAFTRILYFDVQTGTQSNHFLVVYVYGVVLFLASCTSMYKQAPKQTYFNLFMFTGWCFYSHLALWCTNGHQNKPIFSCLYLWGGAFTRILYFDVQTGTESKLFLVVYVYEVVLFSHLVLWCTNMHQNKPILVVYVYGVVLLVASCTSVYKQAPKQSFFQLFMFKGWCFYSHLALRCTNRHQNKAFFSCLCLRGGAFTRILYFDVQTSTKTNLSLVVCVYGIVLLLASCTSMYKQAPKLAYL